MFTKEVLATAVVTAVLVIGGTWAMKKANLI